MQKKIIALAIASALTVPAIAMADGGNVGLYGQVNLSADRVNHGEETNSTSSNELVSNGSRLGVAGNEDIGGGLTAMFQVEGGVDQVSGANTFAFNRNTFVGLKSDDMGTLLAGRYDSAYKSSTRGLDLFGDTTADNQHQLGHNKYAHDTGRENSLNYMSPSMGGFSVAAGVAKAQSGYGHSVSMAGMYGMDNLYAALAYDKISAQAGGTEGKAIKLGGSYTIDAVKLNAVVERLTDSTGTPAVDSKRTNFYVGGQFNLSEADAIKLAFAKRGDSTGNTDNVKAVTVGYNHSMSKRTSVYGLFTKVTDNGTTGLIKNADPSTLSVGMKHAF